MNYYERIQRSLEYLESRLLDTVDLQMAAREAYMSTSTFYRMFFALVGYPAKEYVRLRRSSLAASDLKNTQYSVMDLAAKYDFNSADSFSRAFRRITGFLPSDFRKTGGTFSFERMSVMDEYFDSQDKDLQEKYPEIKVLRNLEPMRAAYYSYFGENPEENAFAVMKKWLSTSGIRMNEQRTRIFGYNNPSPVSEDQREYGYEVCVTIDRDTLVDDPLVKAKTLEGGLYAVTSVKRGDDGSLGREIISAWNRFSRWLSDSKYTNGKHQWLEEHLGFDEDSNHVGGVDLYMPISERSTS
ncbi:MAG: helix-turn-helix domain-containing protein [Eubacteriales bacterium]